MALPGRVPAETTAQSGVCPSRIAASRAASMLPPETMQTILPSPARPESAAATASAPAPSAITRARSASSPHRGGGLVERQRDAAGEQRPRAFPHRAEQHLAAGAVDERRRVVDLDRRAGRVATRRTARPSRARRRARASRGSPTRARSRSRSTGRRRPRGRARCRSPSRSSTSSRPIVPLPAITASSSTGWTK